MNKVNRRQFINATGGAAAVAATTPRLAFSADSYGDNILVFVFQRGGIDGLSFHVPMNGHPDRARYEELRSNGTMLPSNSLLVQCVVRFQSTHLHYHMLVQYISLHPVNRVRTLPMACNFPSILVFLFVRQEYQQLLNQRHHQTPKSSFPDW